jgi:hypothetical protein
MDGRGINILTEFKAMPGRSETWRPCCGSCCLKASNVAAPRRSAFDRTRTIRTTSFRRSGGLRPNGGAQHRNLDPQDVLLNDAARPDESHQRVSVDHGSRRLEERHQDVERSSPELDRLAVSEKLASMRQHLEATKREAHRCFRVSIP